MADQIEILTTDLADIADILRKNNELSFEIVIKDLGRKALLMSCASYFEHILTRDVQAFFDEQFGANHPASHVAKTKAINRQYHTWFDWDKANANKFFSMFGPGFVRFMQDKVKASSDLDRNIRDFLRLGEARNLLVHNDFLSYPLNDDITEIVSRYLNARDFVSSVKGCLAEYVETLNPEAI